MSKLINRADDILVGTKFIEVGKPYKKLKDSIVQLQKSQEINTVQKEVNSISVAVDEMSKYELYVSPYNIVKDLRSVDTQSLTISADIIGYNNYVINYKIGDKFIGDRYKVWSGATQDVNTEYFTFSLTQDSTYNPTKTYYTLQGTYYEECVNITSLVTGVQYYERNIAVYATGVYYQFVYAHLPQIILDIPKANNYSDKVNIYLYNKYDVMDSTSIEVLDQTEYKKCIKIMTSVDNSFPSQTDDYKNVVEGDFVVFSENNTTIIGNPSAGSVWYKIGSGNWVEAGTKEKSEEKLLALEKLIESNVSLDNLNETSVIKWFSEIVATSITADYIGAKQIQIHDGGTIRGGGYDVNGNITEGQTGIYISSDGKLKASNAAFTKISIDETSTINGQLDCGITIYDEDPVTHEKTFNRYEPVLKTQSTASNETAYESIINGTTSLPDGFKMSEVNTYVNNNLGSTSTSPWGYYYTSASGGSASATLPSILSKPVNTGGLYFNKNLTSIVKSTSSDNRLIITGESWTRSSSGAPEVNIYFYNPFEFNVTAYYSFTRGSASWKVLWSGGTAYATGNFYTSDGRSGGLSSSGGITMIPHSRINFKFGYIEPPSSSWNDGCVSSYISITVNPTLSKGINFYNERTRINETGIYDMTDISTQDNGANFSWNGGSVSILRTLASWGSSFTKLFKYKHSFGGSYTFDTTGTYTVITRLHSLKIIDSDGNLHGVASNPDINNLQSVSISPNEFYFIYEALRFSQRTDLNEWIQESNVEITVSTMSRGLYTSTLFPIKDSNGVYPDIGGQNTGEQYRKAYFNYLGQETKTSTDAVIIGSKEISDNTIAGLKAAVAYSNGLIGSVNLTDGPAGNYWYLYQYIPHRCGGNHGDNYSWGTLFLYPMTAYNNMNKIYKYNLVEGTWDSNPYVFTGS